MPLPRTALPATLLIFAMAGCSSLAFPPAPTESTLAVTGNWQVASSAPAAVRLPSLSGELSGSGSGIAGIFHSNSTSACVPPSTTIALTGSANSANVLTLAGGLAGGALSLTGTLAADGKSLTAATYTVTGGACAFAAPALATAQAFSPITGTYTGTFADAAGPVLSITATLTQTPASDPNGNFQLSGTGTLAANPCFSSPATVTNSQVTGGNFALTYTDPSLANSVAASGTFSTDGKTLTVTDWTLTGACGPDSGTGTITRP